jgi:hypothetical protein
MIRRYATLVSGTPNEHDHLAIPPNWPWQPRCPDCPPEKMPGDGALTATPSKRCQNV